ncbi:hypothetical protein llap_10622 [Limosa lapponica baueri]|uniref:Uncharacterized protein n=1 Tax=Limosa lapponica baueri TaxID=1758121 RepID=A0A2I0TZ10_LIMLA|nr:hypothetical protein llap_10622 [Limosa lapponica baueri]
MLRYLSTQKEEQITPERISLQFFEPSEDELENTEPNIAVIAKKEKKKKKKRKKEKKKISFHKTWWMLC